MEELREGRRGKEERERQWKKGREEGKKEEGEAMEERREEGEGGEGEAMEEGKGGGEGGRGRGNGRREGRRGRRKREREWKKGWKGREEGKKEEGATQQQTVAQIYIVSILFLVPDHGHISDVMLLWTNHWPQTASRNVPCYSLNRGHVT